MSGEQLSVSFEIDKKQLFQTSLRMYIKGLGNFLFFWGTLILVSGFGYYFLNIAFFGVACLVSTIIPLGLFLYDLYRFRQSGNDYFAQLKPDEKIVTYIFSKDSDGFETRCGKDYSFTSWDSVRFIEELDDCFIFSFSYGYVYISKTGFREQAEIGFFRFLISSKMSERMKLYG